MKLKVSRVRREQATEADKVIARLVKQVCIEEVDVKGIQIKVLPGVFSPKFSHAADFMIDRWSIPKGSSVLDLGCGCGILGIFALRDGAGSVLAVDINPTATENAQVNFVSLSLEDRAWAKQSDAYSVLSRDDYFDVILLSPPYADRAPKSLLERACFDENYNFLSRAISGIPTHLKVNGRVFLNFSDQGSITKLLQLIQVSGLFIEQFIIQRPSIMGGHCRLFLELSLRKSQSMEGVIDGIT
jgi:methylase of polypeptide subunit release factors